MTRDEAMMEPIEKVALAMLAEADSTHLWDDLPPSAQADLEQSPKPPSARCWTGWSWWLGITPARDSSLKNGA